MKKIVGVGVDEKAERLRKGETKGVIELQNYDDGVIIYKSC